MSATTPPEGADAPDHGGRSHATGAATGSSSEVWDLGDGTQVTLTGPSQVRTLRLGGGLGSGSRRQAVVAAVLGVVFTSAMVTLLMAIAIWPGEAKLTAGVLCPTGRTDVFVVTDTVQASEGGTATDYTMYCVGPRGEATEIHFLEPFAVLWAAHAVLLGLAVLAWSLLSPRRRRRRRDRRAGEGSGHDIETQFEPPGPIIS